MGWKEFSVRFRVSLLLAVLAFVLSEMYFMVFNNPSWEFVDILLFKYTLFALANAGFNIPFMLIVFPAFVWFILGFVVQKIYSLVKNSSYWLRGGTIGLNLFIVFGFAGFLHSRFCSSGWCDLEGVAVIIYSFLFIPLLALIGWIVGKVKEKK